MGTARGLSFIRQKHCMTMESLGNQLEVTKFAVAKWEKGVNKIPQQKLKKLVEVFNLPEELFDKELNEDDKILIQRLIIENDIRRSAHPGNQGSISREQQVDNKENIQSDNLVIDLEMRILEGKKAELLYLLDKNDIDILLRVKNILDYFSGEAVMNVLLAAAEDYLQLPSCRISTGTSDYHAGRIHRDDSNISRLVNDLDFIRA